MKIAFIADSEPCTVFGVTFEPGVAVDAATLPPLAQKLVTNPAFAIVAEAEPAPKSTKKEA